MSMLVSRLLFLISDKNLRNQVGRFIVAGFSGLFTDLLLYRTLVALGTHVTPAKAVGCVAGTVIVFFINSSWTFSSQQGSLPQFLRFSLLYSTSITVNTVINTFGLQLIPEPWQVSFIMATGVSTVMNFLGSKFLVFKPCTNASDSQHEPSADIA